MLCPCLLSTFAFTFSNRLVPVQSEHTGGATGWCLEVHHLAASKLVAGRERDVGFLRLLLAEGMADPAVLGSRLHEVQPRGGRFQFRSEAIAHGGCHAAKATVAVALSVSAGQAPSTDGIFRPRAGFVADPQYSNRARTSRYSSRRWRSG